MSFIKSQKSETVKRGQSSVAATVIKLTGATYTLEVARMQNTTGCCAQLRRPQDKSVIVSQTDIDTVAISGGEAGQEVLIITLHDDPAVEVA